MVRKALNNAPVHHVTGLEVKGKWTAGDHAGPSPAAGDNSGQASMEAAPSAKNIATSRTRMRSDCAKNSNANIPQNCTSTTTLCLTSTSSKCGIYVHCGLFSKSV